MHGSAATQQAFRRDINQCCSGHIVSSAFTRGLPSLRRTYFLKSCSGAVSPLRTRVASAKDISKSHSAAQQRPGAFGDVQEHGEPHSHIAAVSRSTDDSLKIIMLLSLSLILMLLPWMSRHPEFLFAPLLLAVTPVVGNGVRPVLKEAGTSLLTALRLSFGVLTHLEQQQQLSAHHHGHHDNHHHHHHHHHHSHSTHHRQQQHNPGRSNLQHQHQQQQPQGPYSRLPRQQHHQHPAPAGPHSPWPNPAQMPASWPQLHTVTPATTVSSGAGDADSDWAPRAPPDPHHLDPHSQQHLQQVLAADDQVEQELEQSLAAAAAVSSAGVGSMSRSPAGSPGSSMDAGHAAEHIGGSGSNVKGVYRSHSHHHHHHHHGRDPRMLTREEKQQLYHSHPHHQQQQQQQQQHGGAGAAKQQQQRQSHQ